MSTASMQSYESEQSHGGVVLDGAAILDSSAVHAGDVMAAPVVTVSASDSLWSAWTTLHGFGLRYLVVTRGSQCVGVIDDRQIAMQWPLGVLQGHPVTVGELMRPRVRSVQRDTPVQVVAQIMLDECIDVVPVVSTRGEILGLVTVGELLTLLAQPAGTNVTTSRGPEPLSTVPAREQAES
jgi:CBS-domain-containing membrane protein